MGSPPHVRAPSGAVLSLTVVSLALGMSLVALLMAPLVHSAPSPDWKDTTLPFTDSSEEVGEDYCQWCCRKDPVDNHVTKCDINFCDTCCLPPVHPPQPIPSWCDRRPPPPKPFYLVAQIALGAALVVAITALVSIVLRTCSGRERNQGRPQFRPAGASNTSLDMYVQERMQDCPPCYDEISWEKPPSYANLPIIERATEAPHRREPPPSAMSVSDTSEPAGAAAPPPSPGIVFTISQRVEQPAPVPTPQAAADGAQVDGAVRAEETSHEATPAAAAGIPTTNA